MANINTTKQFISILKQARIDKNLTQLELGKLVGMGQKKIAMIENLTASPRLDVLLIILSALELTLTLEDSDKQVKDLNLVWEEDC